MVCLNLINSNIQRGQIIVLGASHFGYGGDGLQLCAQLSRKIVLVKIWEAHGCQHHNWNVRHGLVSLCDARQPLRYCILLHLCTLCITQTHPCPSPQMLLLPKVGVHTCDAILQVACHLDELRKQGLAINISWFQRQCMQTLLETSLELSARHGIT